MVGHACNHVRERRRQEHQLFKVRLGCTVRPCLLPYKKGVGGGETGQRQTRREWLKVNVHIELLYWVFWRGRVAVGMTCFSVWDIIYCNGEGRIISSVAPDAWKTLLMSPGLLSS